MANFEMMLATLKVAADPTKELVTNLELTYMWDKANERVPVSKDFALGMTKLTTAIALTSIMAFYKDSARIIGDPVDILNNAEYCQDGVGPIRTDDGVDHFSECGVRIKIPMALNSVGCVAWLSTVAPHTIVEDFVSSRLCPLIPHLSTMHLGLSLDTNVIDSSNTCADMVKIMEERNEWMETMSSDPEACLKHEADVAKQLFGDCIFGKAYQHNRMPGQSLYSLSVEEYEDLGRNDLASTSGVHDGIIKAINSIKQ